MNGGPVRARTPRLLAALTLAALAGLALLLPAAPAQAARSGAPDRAGPGGAWLAQTSPAPATTLAGLELDVQRMSGTVGPDGVLRLRVGVTNHSRQEREGLRVVATVHQRTRSRFEYQQAVDHGVLGAVVHAFALDLGPVPPHGVRTVDLEQSAQDLGLARMAGLEGVYPLRLQILEGDEVATELVTSFVAITGDVEAPLSVAFLLMLEHPPSRNAEGVFTDLGLADALVPDGALGGVLDVLTSRGDVPVTLAADALALEEVADVAAGFLVSGEPRPEVYPASTPQAARAREFLGDLRAAVTSPDVELLALPYASADLVALVRGGLPSEAARHLTDGARALEAATGVRPSDEFLVAPAGLTPDALLTALGTGARAFVLRPSEVAMPQITGVTPSSLRRMRAGQGTIVEALVDDPWLDPLLDRRQRPPVTAAQRVLGELATIYFERPNRPSRGVLVRLGPGEGAELLEAVATAPFLAPTTLSRFRDAVQHELDPVRLAYQGDARLLELSPAHVAGLQQARRALGSLDGVLVDDRATPGRLDRVLLQAASTHYGAGGDPEAGQALLDTVTGTVEDLYAAVVVPETPAVTLTGLQGELPVTVRSTAAVPLRVRVHLRTGRLVVEGGPTREIVLEPDSTHVLMLPVRALNPGGTAPVEVQVTDVDGSVVLAGGQVVVRSTGFSVTAVLAVAGAAVFLLGWWVREVARRRQRADAPGPAGGPQREAGGRRTGAPRQRAASPRGKPR